MNTKTLVEILKYKPIKESIVQLVKLNINSALELSDELIRNRGEVLLAIDHLNKYYDMHDVYIRLEDNKILFITDPSSKVYITNTIEQLFFFRNTEKRLDASKVKLHYSGVNDVDDIAMLLGDDSLSVQASRFYSSKSWKKLSIPEKAELMIYMKWANAQQRGNLKAEKIVARPTSKIYKLMIEEGILKK